jgi:hypothetical protein
LPLYRRQAVRQRTDATAAGDLYWFVIARRWLALVVIG